MRGSGSSHAVRRIDWRPSGIYRARRQDGVGGPRRCHAEPMLVAIQRPALARRRLDRRTRGGGHSPFHRAWQALGRSSLAISLCHEPLLDDRKVMPRRRRYDRM
jgi:hypothetical protein